MADLNNQLMALIEVLTRNGAFTVEEWAEALERRRKLLESRGLVNGQIVVPRARLMNAWNVIVPDSVRAEVEPVRITVDGILQLRERVMDTSREVFREWFESGGKAMLEVSIGIEIPRFVLVSAPEIKQLFAGAGLQNPHLSAPVEQPWEKLGLSCLWPLAEGLEPAHPVSDAQLGRAVRWLYGWHVVLDLQTAFAEGRQIDEFVFDTCKRTAAVLGTDMGTIGNAPKAEPSAV